MTLDRLKEIIENHDFILHAYKEEGRGLCGYELETWTTGSVNMFHFIDCRDDGKSALNPDDIVEEIKQISCSFDVDEEIDIHRQDESYRQAFTCRQSVEDFEVYEVRLRELAEAVSKEDDN